MGKRPRDSMELQDATSTWGRRYLIYISRTGVRSAIKRRARRRERREAKRQLRQDA